MVEANDEDGFDQDDGGDNDGWGEDGDGDWRKET